MNSHLCEFWDVIKFDLHEEVFNRFLKIIYFMYASILSACMYVPYYMGALLMEAFGNRFTDSCEPCWSREPKLRKSSQYS